MNEPTHPQGTPLGSEDLRLPDDLRGPLSAHLGALREAYRRRGWGGRVGFGDRPAVVVIDLARYWLDPGAQIGSHLDPVVEATGRILTAARGARVPIVFTTFDPDPAEPACPHDKKLQLRLPPDARELFALDPRLQRRPTEKVIRKHYASAFKGTNLHEVLAALGVDTLIVTGVSTSHCVYATCRDATDSFRVVVPREAVGERCELMHQVFLLDIDLDLGDVVEVDQVIRYLQARP
jgi:nicotinamidase-related amidase